MSHLRRDQGLTVELSTSDDLRAALAAVGAATLPVHEWDEVATLIEHLRNALDANDLGRIEEIESRLNNVAFAAQVHARLGGPRRHAPAVAPTKQSPALPIAGAICGAFLLGLGWALGGGVLLIGTGALALFVLGIALAGTTTVSGRRGHELARTPEPTVAAPAHVQRALADLHREVEQRPEMGRPAPE